YWQVAKGRTDRKRSHFELSRFLWIFLGVALVIVAGFTVWVVSVGFTDVIPISADHSTTGSWAVIDGIGKHRGDYHASFLYDLRDNRVIRIPPLRQGAAVEFSADDRTLAFVSRPERAQFGELHVAKVGSVALHPVATGIRATGNYALSDDGS